MTFESFVQSAKQDETPPEGLSPELESLWYTKADRWDEANDIAQDIPSKTGSWIHGLLHAIEGDFGNSAYWYNRAGEKPISASEIESEWEKLTRSFLPES